jgi:hypothetical protein
VEEGFSREQAILGLIFLEEALRKVTSRKCKPKLQYETNLYNINGKEGEHRDGTTHLVMTPLEFLQRLAALVPRPRLHLIRFHGVLALNAALRSQIVPGEADSEMDPTDGDGDRSSTSPRARMSWAQILTRIFAIDITTYPQCGGPLTILAAIADPSVIVKILSHLGLPTRAPPQAPARLDAFVQTA